MFDPEIPASGHFWKSMASRAPPWSAQPERTNVFRTTRPRSSLFG